MKALAPATAATIRFMIEGAWRGTGGPVGGDRVAHWFCMNWTKMPPSTTTRSPACRPARDLVAIAGAVAQRHRPAGETAVGLRRHRRTAGSRRRAASPIPAPAGRCCDWREWICTLHVHLLLRGRRRDWRRRCAPLPRACPGSPARRYWSTVPVTCLRADAGRSPRPDRRPGPSATSAAGDLRHHPDPRQVGDGETRRAAGLQQLPGRDRVSRTTVPAIGARMVPPTRATGRPAWMP